MAFAKLTELSQAILDRVGKQTGMLYTPVPCHDCPFANIETMAKLRSTHEWTHEWAHEWGSQVRTSMVGVRAAARR